MTIIGNQSVELTIVKAHSNCDYDTLQSVYIQLFNEKSKLDKWFDKYLDMFNDKMSDADRNDPMWKLYRAKFTQYNKLTDSIKTVQYYLKTKRA